MIGLAYLRKLHNFTMEQLGILVGVTRQSIDIWEKGKKPIPQYRIEQFAEIFEVAEIYIDKELTNNDMAHLLSLEVNKLRNVV